MSLHSLGRSPRHLGCVQGALTRSPEADRHGHVGPGWCGTVGLAMHLGVGRTWISGIGICVGAAGPLLRHRGPGQRLATLSRDVPVPSWNCRARGGTLGWCLATGRSAMMLESWLRVLKPRRRLDHPLGNGSLSRNYACRTQRCRDRGLLCLEVAPVAIVVKRCQQGAVPGYLVSFRWNHELVVSSTEIVKVGRIKRTFHNRLDGWRHAAKSFEVQAAKERVSSNLIRCQPICRIADEPFQQIACLLGDMWIRRDVEPSPPVHDSRGCHRRIMALIAEGRAAKQHLKHDDAQ
mmetsp:Transcript_22301/g.51651  ORF Transcript_22301/g.51651 Transcript_22301/m.51651 type:complete len:292 (+) Transcript_22301:143-1018(+)